MQDARCIVWLRLAAVHKLSSCAVLAPECVDAATAATAATAARRPSCPAAREIPGPQPGIEPALPASNLCLVLGRQILYN